MNDLTYENHKYYIDRLDIRSEVLGRLYTPEELRGKHAMPFVFSLITILLCIFIPWVLLIPVVCFLYLISYQTKYKLYELEDILPGFFMRVSKSTILNTNHIYSINRNLTASSVVAFSDTHKQVYVSRYYYKPLISKLEEKRLHR